MHTGPTVILRGAAASTAGVTASTAAGVALVGWDRAARHAGPAVILSRHGGLAAWGYLRKKLAGTSLLVNWLA